MLKGTSSQFVLITETAKFQTKMGVIQGSVLSALFFTILITPLSTALRPFSPIINSIRVAPQFFADGGTLIQLGHENEEILTRSRQGTTVCSYYQLLIMYSRNKLGVPNPESENRHPDQSRWDRIFGLRSTIFWLRPVQVKKNNDRFPKNSDSNDGPSRSS